VPKRTRRTRRRGGSENVDVQYNACWGRRSNEKNFLDARGSCVVDRSGGRRFQLVARCCSATRLSANLLVVVVSIRSSAVVGGGARHARPFGLPDPPFPPGHFPPVLSPPRCGWPLEPTCLEPIFVLVVFERRRRRRQPKRPVGSLPSEVEMTAARRHRQPPPRGQARIPHWFDSIEERDRSVGVNFWMTPKKCTHPHILFQTRQHSRVRLCWGLK
jgi:hypothetical protein